MDGMGFLIALASFVLVIVALNKSSKLEVRIAQLKLQVGQLADEIARLRPTPVAPAPEPPPAPVAQIAPEPVAAPEIVTPPPEPAKPPHDMEQALASRWFVWIGAIAIAIGGLLFVKYAYDNGLISDALQVALGLLAGAVLVAAGEFVRRKSTVTAEANYVPAALSAAGLVTAFGSVFAAYALYELIAPTTAFAGLALIAVAALALSRLQGPLIAALGLIGSYATPALIPSEQPSAWNFFPYLLIILIASFAVLRGRNWWWLAFAAIAGSGAWAALWIWGGQFTFSDILPIGLFAHALGLVAFYGLRAAPPAIGLVGLGVEAFLLMALVQASNHDDLALVLFFANMAGLIFIAWRNEKISWAVGVASLLSFLVLMLWSDVAIHDVAMDERGLWSSVPGVAAQRFLDIMLASALVFTLAGCFGALWQARPRYWGLASGLSPMLFVGGAWARVDVLFSPELWALIAAVFAGLLLGAAWLGRARHDEPEANLASGFLSIGAALILLFSLDRMLDDVWLTLGIAGLALGFALLAGRMRVNLQGPIAASLGSLAALRLFVSRELWTEDRSLPWGQHWPLYGYGVPVILFLLASKVLKAAGHIRSAITLEGVSLGLVISLVALELRVLISGGITYDEPQFLEMSAHILTWAGAAYGLMHRQQLFSSFIATWGARVLLLASGAAIVLLSLVALNPVVTEAPVPGNIVFNALLLAYLAPVLLIGLIARKLEVLGWQALKPIAGFLALLLAFVYVTLETKRVFQGHVLVAHSETVAESYAYSVVWLAFALALFIAGLRFSRQYIRYAGLGVIVLVILKVFLWDMSSLEGLYRIASFIGLGLCLVGVGWLYQRFVQRKV